MTYEIHPVFVPEVVPELLSPSGTRFTLPGTKTTASPGLT